jgi:chromosome segregation ATPase
LQQQLDSAEAELQASRQRITNLEATNTKLRSENSEGAARTAAFGRVVTSLQDLDRRRDAYLTSIIRRYRDITSEFRAMSGMLDSGRDPNSNVFSGATLTRIQNAISLADDDLRQLSELNAQARELEKKLVKK